MKIKIGPSGLGPIKTAREILESYKKSGIKLCEVGFTRSIYMKKDDALKIGKIAKELGIELSIHAPYYVNLNSEELEKVEASKKRILKCCELGDYLGARNIVFHPGYYGKDKENTFANVKMRIIEMLEEVKKNKWKVRLCPETMGKINVFGSPEEISQLVKETGCGFCIDFAHILAREKKVDFEKIKKLFPQEEWHCHFSGIEYGEKGEKHHEDLEKKDWENLFEKLPKNKKINIVCESPSRIENSIEGIRILEKS